MSQPNLDRLRGIETLPQLLAYLRDDLDWPIEPDDVEEFRPRELAPERLYKTPAFCEALIRSNN